MPNIHHLLLISASPEKVFSAITTQEGLAGWWTPQATAHPEIGSIARFPFGPEYFKEMKIVKLEPSKYLEWNCIAGASEWIGTTLTFTLSPTDRTSVLKEYPEIQGQVEQQANFKNGTVLMFHHDNWNDYTPMFAECSYTWGRFLRSLKLYCETGKGRPSPHQHVVHS